MPKYPSAIKTLKGALASQHEFDAIRSIHILLMKGKRYRTRYMLTAFGNAFCRRFVKEPTTVRFEPDAEASFNHRTREIIIGKNALMPLLHEIGHAKYGESEEVAVFFSVGLLLHALPSFVPILNGHVLENDPY